MAVDLGAFFLRRRLRAEDWARTHHLGAWPALLQLSIAMLTQGSVLPQRITRYLVSAHPSRWQKPLVNLAIQSSRRRIAMEQTHDVRITRSIVVKKPGKHERGILLVSFEDELEKLVLSRGFPDVECSYQIVFLPTWQPCYSPALFLLAARATRPYAIMPASIDDLLLDRVLGDLCVPLPFQASSWVATTPSVSRVRDIDILMVANFSRYKRHWRLFEALGDLPPDLTVVLAGRPWGGRTAETLRREARAFGVESRIRIVEDATDSQIADLLGRARIFCALSHKEGSYIAVAEALMSGTPVALYGNALVGSKAYVTPQTGFLMDPKRPLGPQLLDALGHCASLDPAAWSRREISAEANCVKLNDVLRSWNTSRGALWTADVVPFHCRSFSFDYLHRADRISFEETYRHLLHAAQLSFAEFPVSPEHH